MCVCWVSALAVVGCVDPGGSFGNGAGSVAQDFLYGNGALCLAEASEGNWLDAIGPCTAAAENLGTELSEAIGELRDSLDDAYFVDPAIWSEDELMLAIGEYVDENGDPDLEEGIENELNEYFAANAKLSGRAQSNWQQTLGAYGNRMYRYASRGGEYFGRALRYGRALGSVARGYGIGSDIRDIQIGRDRRAEAAIDAGYNAGRETADFYSRYGYTQGRVTLDERSMWGRYGRTYTMSYDYGYSRGFAEASQNRTYWP
jgi:hypothetical protein